MGSYIDDVRLKPVSILSAMVLSKLGANEDVSDIQHVYVSFFSNERMEPAIFGTLIITERYYYYVGHFCVNKVNPHSTSSVNETKWEHLWRMIRYCDGIKPLDAYEFELLSLNERTADPAPDHVEPPKRMVDLCLLASILPASKFGYSPESKLFQRVAFANSISNARISTLEEYNHALIVCTNSERQQPQQPISPCSSSKITESTASEEEDSRTPSTEDDVDDNNVVFFAGDHEEVISTNSVWDDNILFAEEEVEDVDMMDTSS